MSDQTEKGVTPGESMPTSKEVEEAMKHFDGLNNPGREEATELRKAQHRATVASLSASPEPEAEKREWERQEANLKTHVVSNCGSDGGSIVCDRCGKYDSALTANPCPASLQDVEAGLEQAHQAGIKGLISGTNWVRINAGFQNELRIYLRAAASLLVAPLEAKVADLQAQIARLKEGR